MNAGDGEEADVIVQTTSARRPAAPVPGAGQAGPFVDRLAPRGPAPDPPAPYAPAPGSGSRAPRSLRPGRLVRLHSRAHVDLQRVAAALCRP